MAIKVKSKSSASRNTKNNKSHSRAQRAVTKHAASKTPLLYIPWHTIPLDDVRAARVGTGTLWALAAVLSLTTLGRSKTKTGR